MEKNISPRTEVAPSEASSSKESLYRTKWLMAHNRLHDLAHNGSLVPTTVWEEYLNELKSAEAVAKTPA